jgi:hypothetical protein
MIKNLTKKNNSPSPTSYETSKAFEKLSGSPANDRGGRYYGISKSKKITFAEKNMVLSKKTPGVGKYESAVALDKISRPMVRYKN